MELPKPLFAIINPIVGFLLRSPIHGFWSDSLMLITFRGRKSQREFSTPVRYVRDEAMVRCFTSAENRWWRNMRGGAEVTLRINGKDGRYIATAIEDDSSEIKEQLLHYLEKFPQDAAYHKIRLNPDKTLVKEDLEEAAQHAIIVEARPI